MNENVKLSIETNIDDIVTLNTSAAFTLLVTEFQTLKLLISLTNNII